ncbi:hypothetical protein CHARACLAT_018522 [Characodon lateralis]|uniref:Uncharacterized protein n=1 Tax=Characodon lateralis TaxID=208331 RepID=A0ABU7F420_9TELE|nr:hypothetical protein [Characodon lateralis]
MGKNGNGTKFFVGPWEFGVLFPCLTTLCHRRAGGVDPVTGVSDLLLIVPARRGVFRSLPPLLCCLSVVPTCASTCEVWADQRLPWTGNLKTHKTDSSTLCLFKTCLAVWLPITATLW